MSSVCHNQWTWPNCPHRPVILRRVRDTSLAPDTITVTRAQSPGWTWSMTWRTSRTSATRSRASWSSGIGSGSSQTVPAPPPPPRCQAAVQRFVTILEMEILILILENLIPLLAQVDRGNVELRLIFDVSGRLAKLFVWIRRIRNIWWKKRVAENERGTYFRFLFHLCF